MEATALTRFTPIFKRPNSTREKVFGLELWCWHPHGYARLCRGIMRVEQFPCLMLDENSKIVASQRECTLYFCLFHPHCHCTDILHQSLRKETNAVSGMRVTIVHKNQNTMPPLLPSHQWHEVEVCRGKEVSRAESDPGIILRHPCRYYLNGTCSRSLCECWHPPEWQIYKTESGCNSGDKCLFPRQKKVDEQPNKKPRKGYGSHKRRENYDKNAVRWVVSHNTRMRWFLKEAHKPGETRGKKSWDPLEKYGSLSLRHVKQISRKRKDHRLEKYKSKILISEVHTPWNLRTGPKKRLKANSDAPEARHGTLPNTKTSEKRKDQATFSSPTNEWIFAGCIHHKNWRKESLW